MIATVAPEYQLAVHVTVSNGWRLPYIKIAEPYAYIGDLYHNGEQELLKLIQSLEAILTGQSSELVDFAWERVICTTEGELTYCEDMHTQAHCIVKTRWMLQMLKDFYAFRMQFR